MDKSEPHPSHTQLDSRLFYIGKDRRGHWVAQDQNGLRGGVFVDRAKAFKFALSENGRRPEAIIAVSGVLELGTTARPTLADHLVVFTNNAPATRYLVPGRQQKIRRAGGR